MILWPHLLQAGLLAAGLLGMVLLIYADSVPKKRRAYVVLLSGQPFWIGITIGAQQWGMVAMTVLYTALYVVAIYKTKLESNL
jgi:hypothetical protein